MLTLGTLAFLTPWVLGLLVFLPALWWLLRVTPPGPRRQLFPAIRLLRELEAGEQTPARTPWWLLALRMAVAALIILALAGPVRNPERALAGPGPVVLVVDNGLGAARSWDKRQEAMAAYAERAGRAGRKLYLLTTAPPRSGRQVAVEGPMRPAEMARRARGMAPVPWPVDRARAMAVLEDFHARLNPGTGPGTNAQMVWLTNDLQGMVARAPRRVAPPEGGGPRGASGAASGAASGTATPPPPRAEPPPEGAGGAARDAKSAAETDKAFARLLQRFGEAVVVSGVQGFPRFLGPPESRGESLEVPVHRPYSAGPGRLAVRALGPEGRLIGRQELSFARGQATATARFRLPAELRREIARLAIEGEDGPGARYLMDARWRERPVGLVGGASSQGTAPLLDELHYLETALSPYSTVHRGELEAMLERDLAVLILADIGTLTLSQREQLSAFVAGGGVLVRFAGPRLARATRGDDSLLPVRLRMGERALGGAMSWGEPQALATMPDHGPLAGLALRSRVTVRRQVLADPSLQLEDKVWARLEDGTPLVTGAARGEGWLVLVHTTADANWSNLALSGIYVGMLERLVDLSAGLAGAEIAAPLEPIATLDGRGRLGGPAATARPIPGDAFGRATVSRDHPPGFYGREGSRRALNVTDRLAPPRPLAGLPAGVSRAVYGGRGEVALGPPLLLAALILATLDLLITLLMRGSLAGLAPFKGRGRVKGRGRAKSGPAPANAALALGLGLAALLAVLFAVLFTPAPARAQGPSADTEAGAGGATADSDAPPAVDERFAMKVSTGTYLGYIRTGDAQTDRTSRAGMRGLTRILNRRTAIESEGPIEIELGRDALGFFPILYWPITPAQPRLSESQILALNRYLRHGGILLFDTGDRELGGVQAGDGPGARRLQQLVARLDVPPIEPLREDHVLTRAFYLLQAFPGRYSGGRLWVEATGDAGGAGVGAGAGAGAGADSVSPVIVSHNDLAGAWAVDEQGRPLHATIPGGDRQREMAYRTGVNILMYAMTGNYKGDQVHMPHIMERLSQ